MLIRVAPIRRPVSIFAIHSRQFERLFAREKRRIVNRNCRYDQTPIKIEISLLTTRFSNK